jgi:hypothetical protein
MSTRYWTNMLIALLGGFVVVESLTFPEPAGAWVAFAFGTAVVAISLLALVASARGQVQRTLDVVLVAIAGTLIGVSVVYGGGTVEWLDFALALGSVGAAVTGLTLNEISHWRAAQGLAEVRTFPGAHRQRRQTGPAAPASDVGPAAAASGWSLGRPA